MSLRSTESLINGTPGGQALLEREERESQQCADILLSGLVITELQYSGSFNQSLYLVNVWQCMVIVASLTVAMKLSRETFDWLVFCWAHATLSQLTTDVFIFTVRCQQDDLNVIMFTLSGWGDVPYWDFVTCNLVPTKNKSLVLCQPIVLAPVFAIIRPGEQKACFILQQFYTEREEAGGPNPPLLCYWAQFLHFIKIFFFLNLLTIVRKLHWKCVRIDFHLGNDIHKIRKKLWMSTETAFKTSVFSPTFSLLQ